MRRHSVLLSTFIALGVVAPVPAAPLQPAATVLVVPPQPEEREQAAARLLQEWLRKATRSQDGFAILSAAAAPPPEAAVIEIGATPSAPQTNLYRDGFLIRRRGNRIWIRGGSPAGTFYGAAAFLDRFAGVRFYLPLESWTSLPSRAEVIVPDGVDITEQPYVKNSMMSGVGGMRGTGGTDQVPVRQEEREWLWRNAAFRKDSVEFSHQHSMFQRFPPERFATRYPAIYPLLNGARYIPSDPADQKWNPCFTEPALIDAAVESAEAYFRAHPERAYLSFSIQDSHVHCECDRCTREVKAAPDKATAYSAMNARFLSALARRLEKTRPDKTIVYIAYSDVREPPSEPLHPSILPVVVFTIGDTLIDKRFEPGSHILETWQRVSPQMGNHDWGQGHMYFIPRMYTGLTSRLLREARQRGLTWGYQHMESYPNWGLDGLKLWVTARLWWNPDLEADLLWRQLSRDLFPGARADMERYFDLLHRLWILMDNDAERKLRKWSNQFDLRSEQQRQMVRECRRILNSAAAAAGTSEEKSRVDLLSRSFRLSEMFFEMANAPRVTPGQVEALRRYAREEIAKDPWTVYAAGNPPELMKDIDAALAVVTKGKD
ncbi:MAG: DUF4838 domain-containing protein [Bryobacterales bacterium]|nr:DUF4838 domain-containing protein [Bryobacterales bacterium]